MVLRYGFGPYKKMVDVGGLRSQDPIFVNGWRCRVLPKNEKTGMYMLGVHGRRRNAKTVLKGNNWNTEDKPTHSIVLEIVSEEKGNKIKPCYAIGMVSRNDEIYY